jgi:predicted DNA-binding transcriptional regulator AlpA
MPNLALEAFLERPEAIADLSRDDLAAILAKVKALEGQLLARLLSSDAAQPASNGGDRLLTCDQAAEFLSVPRAWLYRRKTLGLAVKLGDGTLRFSRNAIQQYILESAVKAPHARSGKKAA